MHEAAGTDRRDDDVTDSPGAEVDLNTVQAQAQRPARELTRRDVARAWWGLPLALQRAWQPDDTNGA